MNGMEWNGIVWWSYQFNAKLFTIRCCCCCGFGCFYYLFNLYHTIFYAHTQAHIIRHCSLHISFHVPKNSSKCDYTWLKWIIIINRISFGERRKVINNCRIIHYLRWMSTESENKKEATQKINRERERQASSRSRISLSINLIIIISNSTKLNV